MLPNSGQPYSEKAWLELQRVLEIHGQLLRIDPEKGNMQPLDITLEVSAVTPLMESHEEW